MRLCYLPLFLTLVGLASPAAPEAAFVPQPIRPQDSQATSTKSNVEQDAVQVTLPAGQESSRRDVRILPFPEAARDHSAANNVGMGLISGPSNKDRVRETLTTFHASRTQYNLDESAQEFGVFLTSNKLVGIDWGFKKLCCFSSFAAALDPFYKIGFSGIYEPKDKLANFIDYQRYFLQASIGFEDFFFSQKTWRVETGLRAGYSGIHSFAILFYSFPD